MYSKLFSSIVNSSIWSEDSDTRVVWVTLLAMQDKFGVIYGSVIGLSRLCGIPVGVVQKALDKFSSPDEFSADLSRVPERQGRRIEVVPGGWKVINSEFYNSIKDADERRAKMREAQKKFRDKNREIVINSNQKDITNNDSNHPSEYKYKYESENGKGMQGETIETGFDKFWSAYPAGIRKKGRLKCEKIWNSRDYESIAELILDTLEIFNASHEWRKEKGQFIPGPEPWLNDTPWETDLSELKPAAPKSAAEIERENKTKAEELTDRMLAERRARATA